MDVFLRESLLKDLCKVNERGLVLSRVAGNVLEISIKIVIASFFKTFNAKC